MKAYKSFTLMLALLMLASCGDAAPAGETTAESTTAEVVEISPFDALPDKDFGGYEFRIFMRNDQSFLRDMQAESETGDLMNDTIYARNRKVEERFNIKMSILLAKDGQGADAAKHIMADDDVFDIYMPYGRTALTDAQKEIMVEWNGDTMPDVDLDAPWWDQSARDTFSVGHHVYYMTGDISFVSFGMMNAVFFNKDIFDEYGVKYPYQLAIDGKWTFDEFAKIAKTCQADLNGDSQMTFGEDLVGYVTSEWSGPVRVLYSGGSTIYAKDGDDIPYLAINTERTVDIFDKFFALAADPGVIIETSGKYKTSGTKAFKAGTAAMFEAAVRVAESYRDMDGEFGILPCPKFDETDDKYYCLGGALFLCVPITNPDTARTGLILEAMAIESHEKVLPTYFDVVLERKVTRDEESAEMVRLIHDGRMFDMGFIDNNGAMKDVGQRLSNQAEPNFASFYAANVTSCETALQKTIDAYLN